MNRELQEGRFFGKSNEFIINDINRCKIEIEQARIYIDACLNQIALLQTILAERAVEADRNKNK
jgi:hypothetical protein